MQMIGQLQKERKSFSISIRFSMTLLAIPTSFLIILLYQNYGVFPLTFFMKDIPMTALLLTLVSIILFSIGFQLLLTNKFSNCIGSCLCLVAGIILLIFSLNTYVYFDQEGIHHADLWDVEKTKVAWEEVDYALVTVENREAVKLTFYYEDEVFVHELNQYYSKDSLTNWFETVGLEYDEKIIRAE
ncbi:hypothetical protein [Mangrovibacillus cuniculi]|uniref:Uncharacterized protein n=1 Tax=Mangrovibacillus cuniculi TaxID=2593652 RepID=A0A7S8C9L4_9BACI|nr:hypothetical protein [Mangrovibacillus cuniculi]QPC45903.1 hypothetical protein G8O30_02495 [Mangrovibacillus cuniculi]